jgi:hypothetical protein
MRHALHISTILLGLATATTALAQKPRRPLAAPQLPAGSRQVQIAEASSARDEADTEMRLALFAAISGLFVGAAVSGLAVRSHFIAKARRQVDDRSWISNEMMRALRLFSAQLSSTETRICTGLEELSTNVDSRIEQSESTLDERLETNEVRVSKHVVSGHVELLDLIRRVLPQDSSPTIFHELENTKNRLKDLS